MTAAIAAYAELGITTNFSFLHGGSHPQDYVRQAAVLGLPAIGVADRNTLAGVVRAYGELMGRLYWHKHGVESVFIRIGSAFPEPVDARMLATWLSFPDLARLIHRCVVTEKVGCGVVWGASKNERMTWWGKDARATLNWEPQDSADTFAGQLAGKLSGDPVAERYMGGGFCTIDYSR